MKVMKSLSTILVVPLILLACNSKNKITQQEQKEYEIKIEAKLSELDDKILELKTEAENAGTELRAEIETQITRLERKKKELNMKLQQLQYATEKNWQELKDEIQQKLAGVEEFLNSDIEVSVNGK